jgi:hypothetical protein
VYAYTEMSIVTSAIKRIGLSPIAKRLGYRPSAVQRWQDDGRLPKTDLAGLTNYAQVIAELSEGTEQPVTKEQLLRDTRTAWEAKAF